MPTDAFDRLERLFRAALLHPPGERTAFLDAACDDDELRKEVESLLAADSHADGSDFLDQPATGLLGDFADSDVPPIDTLVGEQVGPYRMLRPLGEGGMGTVYLAVREKPFLRHVALKVIRGRTPAPEVLRRFEQERQILASLNHPGIARLIEGGLTGDGLPYFAMEYVEGRPITTYCDEHRLGIDERLDLFRSVCDAVHEAHQNLVLHRDLKPSNILVTSDREVKLLDFGIAKLLNPNLSPAAMPVTQTALRVMTPEYASPEQVRGEGLSTASDVYGLGIVLYELLAGDRPYRLTRGSADEMVRAVIDVDPERPSTAVTQDKTITLPDGTTDVITAASISEARAASPERLRRSLRGDLDAIVMKALRKEPRQRYPSAEALALDIERYRNGEPVLAHQGSRGYRLGKLVRRHRAETALIAVVLASILGFAVYSSVQAQRLETERDRAQTEAGKAEEVSSFLVSLFEQADPTAAPGDTISVREVLDSGVNRIEATLSDQPVVKAELLHVIAHAYENLGRYDRASSLMERAYTLRNSTLGPTHEETLQSLYDLAELHSAQGNPLRAEEALRTYVAAATERYGENNARVLKATYGIWGALHQQGRSASADSLFPILIAMDQLVPDEDHPDRAYAISEIGYIYMAKTDYGEAEAYFRRALAMQERLHDGPSPELAAAHKNLASALNFLTRHAEAEVHATEAVRLYTLLYPEGHGEAASGLYHLGLTYRGLERYEEAEQAFLGAIDMTRRIHGTRPRTLTQYLDTLAGLYERQGRPEDAESLLREVIAISIDRNGAQSSSTFSAQAYLGDNLRLQRRFAEAESVLLDSHRHLVADMGAEHRITQRVAQNLADLYTDWGRSAEAQRYRTLRAQAPAAE